MFRRLRNSFILTTMTLLTIVIVVSFLVIYIGTTSDFRNDRMGQPLPIGLQSAPFNEEQLRAFVDEQRQASANRLALTLVLTGSATLIAGYFVSRYLADRAIKPVKEAYDKQRQFIADASHELKTPLAVIDASIEAEISDRKHSSKWLKNIQSETGRMSKLVKDLLMLAKFDVTNGHVPAPFNVANTIKEIVESIRPLAKEKSLRLIERIEDPVKVEGYEDKVRQITSILIDNAIKYTDQKGTIEVLLRSRDTGVEIIVSNSHKPISERKLSKLFERFYQADASHRSGGYGLGLAIAKAAADSMHAELGVSQGNGMVKFQLILH